MIVDKGCPDVLCEECQEYCDWYSLDDLFVNFMYLDGTVCGIKE